MLKGSDLPDPSVAPYFSNASAFSRVSNNLIERTIFLFFKSFSAKQTSTVSPPVHLSTLASAGLELMADFFIIKSISQPNGLTFKPSFLSADITLQEIQTKSKVKKFNLLIKNKKDLLIKLNNYFDYKVSSKISNIENSNYKDMIFEVIMMRFDVLQENRKGIISIFNSFKSRPKLLFFLLPALLDSILIMVKSINLPIKGVLGQLKIKGIFVIYVSSFFVWLNDETIALDKTMTALDKYLDQANNILKFINK